jgi:two-component system sensor histidine kinase/response regulator
MHPDSSRSLSLKTKVALTLSLLFTAAIAFVTAMQLGEIRHSMAQVLAAQQDTLVTRVSDEVDEKFRARQAALAGVAAHLGTAIAQSPARAQATLEGHQALRTMFDALFIFSAQGQILAGAPYRPEFARMSVAQRQYFKDALASAKPGISAPYRNLTDGSPFVMMTAPVMDANGKVAAILGGSIGLLGSNFLGDIGTRPVGKSGYIYVMTTGAHAVIVSHPDRKKIMGPVVGAADNPAAARARAGFEGTATGVNSSGLRAMMSFKSLKETGWIVAAVLPEEEAFGPINAAQRRVVMLAGLIAIVIGLLTWILAYWLLVPLASLRQHMHAKREGGGAGADLPVRQRDEIGMLTDEFNQLTADALSGGRAAGAGGQ